MEVIRGLFKQLTHKEHMRLAEAQCILCLGVFYFKDVLIMATTTETSSKAGAFSVMVAAALLSAALVFIGITLKETLLSWKASERYVTVKGLAEREVKADLALWPLHFSVSANSLEILQQKVEYTHQMIRQFLLAKGFQAPMISLSSPQITDQHVNNYGNRLPEDRYRAEATVLVRTPDVQRVKHVISQTGELVSQGVLLAQTYEHRTEFLFTGLNEIKPEMIAAATADARAAADQFAHDAQAEVGSIRNAQQGYFSIEDLDAYTPDVKKVRVVTNIQFYLQE